MSTPVIRLHLGAHKTATTYMQETLLRNRARSAAAGLAYLPLHLVRIPIRRAIEHEAKRRAGRKGRVMAKLVEATVAPRAQLAGLFHADVPITLSEENILGDTNDSYYGGLYPKAEIGLSVMREALPERPLELWLSVRSYASYLTSMYAESLRHGSFIPLEDYQANNRKSPGSWVTLVETIRSIFPEARLVIWRYEDFASLKPEILERLGGVPLAEMEELSRKTLLPRASAQAIERMMAVAPKLSRRKRAFTMLALEGQFPSGEGTARFAPWSEEDSVAMAQRYDRDVAQLRSRSDVEFLG